MKKIITIISIVLFVVIVLCLPYWINNIACNNYRNNIEVMISDVSEIEVLDIVNDCTNVANGKHTYLRVSVLINTDLTKGELKAKLNEVYDVIPYEELYELKLKNEFSEHIIDKTAGYFVLEYAKSAPLWYLDLRGH